ncbi:MAG: hypothetical protein JSR46_06745 [Verrucomicrobia bacterium]|nr:hypothetical protein [Verrucomicrobiota bacterium]
MSSIDRFHKEYDGYHFAFHEGLCFEKQVKWEIKTLEKKIELNPHLPDNYLQLAQKFLWMKDFNQAEKALRIVVRLDPQSAVPDMLLGDIAARDGNYIAARKYWARGLAKDPANKLLQIRASL